MSDYESFSLDSQTPGGFMQGGTMDPWNATYSPASGASYSYKYGGVKKKKTTGKKKKTTGKKKTIKKKPTKKIVGGKKKKTIKKRPGKKKTVRKTTGGKKKKTTKVAMPKVAHHWGGKKAKKEKKSFEFDFHGKKTVIQASGAGRAAEKIAAKMLKSSGKKEGTISVTFVQLSEGRGQNKTFKYSVKRTGRMVKTKLPGKTTMKTYKYEKKKL